MKQHSYLVSYSAKREDSVIIHGEIHLKLNQKMAYEDLDQVRVEIIRTIDENILVRSVVISSIFYFGKEKWIIN